MINHLMSFDNRMQQAPLQPVIQQESFFEWEWPRLFSGLFKKVSTRTQADCFAAFFEVFWEKE